MRLIRVAWPVGSERLRSRTVSGRATSASTTQLLRVFVPTFSELLLVERRSSPLSFCTRSEDSINGVAYCTAPGFDAKLLLVFFVVGGGVKE